MTENLGDFWKTINIFMFLSLLLSQNKCAAQQSYKGCNQQIWNKILTIKLYMGQISGTWEPLVHEYWRKNLIIGGKNTDRVTKTSPFGGNRVISLKPGQKSHPLRIGLISLKLTKNYSPLTTLTMLWSLYVLKYFESFLLPHISSLWQSKCTLSS